MICDTTSCGCAIISTDGSATISGSGTPAKPWDFAVGDPSAITDLEGDVADILAAIAALPATYVKKIGDSMSGPLSVTAAVEAIQLRRTTDGAHIGWYFIDGTRQAYIQAIDATNQFKIAGASGYHICMMPGSIERVRFLADGTAVLFNKSVSNIATVGTEIVANGSIFSTQGITSANYTANKVSGGVASATVYNDFKLSGTTIGSITRNAATSAVLFNATSDEDLKNVISTLDPELAAYVLRLVTPMFYSWKDDEGNTPIAGYIAQQVAAAWPQSIELGLVTPGYGDITKRTFDTDGNETTAPGVWGPWQMSHTILIPILHAGWIWLANKAVDHEARLAALEAA